MGNGHRLGAVDALRGAAILLVVAYHAGPLGFRPPPFDAAGGLILPSLGWPTWLLVPVLHFGYSGVHLFFVLSGFCIHLRAARRGLGPAAPRLGLRDFFLRRFWRIYPPYWIALALFGVLVPSLARLAGRVVEAAGAGDLALHALMLHTFSMRTIFSINPAFWSLATEEQFYLAYPIVLLAIGRFGVRRVLAAALVLSLAWRGALMWLLPPVPPTAERLMEYRVWVHAFFAPRWFEWLLGCALAEAVAAPAGATMARLRARRGLVVVAGGLLLVGGMLCRLHVVADKLLADGLLSSGYALLAAAWLAGSPSGRASRVGAWVTRALGAVGRRAYGIYLVHQPILDGPALALGWRIALAGIAGVAFSAWCERPFERRSARVGRAAAPSPAAEPGDASAAP